MSAEATSRAPNAGRRVGVLDSIQRLFHPHPDVDDRREQSEVVRLAREVFLPARLDDVPVEQRPITGGTDAG